MFSYVFNCFHQSFFMFLQNNQSLTVRSSVLRSIDVLIGLSLNANSSEAMCGTNQKNQKDTETIWNIMKQSETYWIYPKQNKHSLSMSQRIWLAKEARCTVLHFFWHFFGSFLKLAPKRFFMAQAWLPMPRRSTILRPELGSMFV